MIVEYNCMNKCPLKCVDTEPKVSWPMTDAIYLYLQAGRPTLRIKSSELRKQNRGCEMDIWLPDLTESLQYACTVRVVYGGVTLEGLEISVPYGRGSIHQTLDKSPQVATFHGRACAVLSACTAVPSLIHYYFFVKFLICTSKDLLMLISILGCWTAWWWERRCCRRFGVTSYLHPQGRLLICCVYKYLILFWKWRGKR
jgi:hypothetical protein